MSSSVAVYHSLRQEQRVNVTEITFGNFNGIVKSDDYDYMVLCQLSNE